jgi:hypothetical protein
MGYGVVNAGYGSPKPRIKTKNLTPSVLRRVCDAPSLLGCSCGSPRKLGARS